MSFRRRLIGKKLPAGWEKIEEVIEDFEAQMKEAVNEDHAGKRRAELAWPVHRVHWEKNRFIFDLMYKRKVMSRKLYDFLVREKIADGALISKWRKPGYEFLCSMLAIDRGGTNFGTTSVCRVPRASRAPAQRDAPSVQTGCVSCASCDSRFGGPIWWNTPLEGEEGEEEAGAAWAPVGGEGGGGSGDDDEGDAAAAASRKRAAPDDDDDDDQLDDDVRKRLAALKEQQE